MELLRDHIPLCCLSVDKSRDTVKNIFSLHTVLIWKRKMGNKKTKKKLRTFGTSKKTMSKGNGHYNPNLELISDWLKCFNPYLRVFWPSEHENEVKMLYFLWFFACKLNFWPDKARKHINPQKYKANNEASVENLENLETNDDALHWYFNRQIDTPWDRLLEVEECIQKEFYE